MIGFGDFIIAHIGGCLYVYLELFTLKMLRKAVKPKLLGIFIVICAVGIIIVGYFFNAIQYLLV